MFKILSIEPSIILNPYVSFLPFHSWSSTLPDQLYRFARFLVGFHYQILSTWLPDDTICGSSIMGPGHSDYEKEYFSHSNSRPKCAYRWIYSKKIQYQAGPVAQLGQSGGLLSRRPRVRGWPRNPSRTAITEFSRKNEKWTEYC